jgi:hypothetical protein
MPRLVACVTLLLALPLGPLHAQRSFTLLGLTGNASGHARADDDPERPTIAPDHPAIWQLGLTEDHDAWRVAAVLRHARADLAIRGTTSAVLTRGAVRSWSAGLEGGRRFAGATGAPTLHALLGVAVERTTFPVTGGDSRARLVTLVALEGAVPLSGRWHAVVRGEAGRSAALFGANELPPGYAVRAGRRWNLGIGLGWRP